jgi:DNA-directed RNA polymerase subunit RPC12/RpoP
MSNTSIWHHQECYICFEEFYDERPRVFSYRCRHAVCVECWSNMTFKLSILQLNKCSYCNSPIFRDPRGVSSQYTIVETSTGEKILANDLFLYPLQQDFIQSQLILSSKKNVTTSSKL